MVDTKSKFELLAFDKAQVVSNVNAMGEEVAEYESKSPLAKIRQKADELMSRLISSGAGAFSGLRDEISKLGLDSHEGRKDFLSKKLGIDGNTPENYRFVSYTNESGQQLLFKGHMDGDKKLVLTDSLAAPETASQVHQFFQSSFKPLPKPIEVQIEKATVAGVGTKLDLSPDERRKLETQSAFASAIQKSGDVQLTSNARLPGKPQATGPGLNA